MTLNDLERRNGRAVCVVSPNLLAYKTYYVKLVENTPIHAASEYSPKNLVFNGIYHLRRYSQGITPSEGVKVKRTPVASENLT